MKHFCSFSYPARASGSHCNQGGPVLHRAVLSTHVARTMGQWQTRFAVSGGSRKWVKGAARTARNTAAQVCFSGWTNWETSLFCVRAQPRACAERPGPIACSILVCDLKLVDHRHDDHLIEAMDSLSRCLSHPEWIVHTRLAYWGADAAKRRPSQKKTPH